MKLTPVPMQRLFEVLVGFVLFQYVAANLTRNPAGAVTTAVIVIAICATFIKGGIAARVWKTVKKRLNVGASLLVEVLALYLLGSFTAENLPSNPLGSFGWLIAGLVALAFVMPHGIVARLANGGRSRWSSSRAQRQQSASTPEVDTFALARTAPLGVTAPAYGDPSSN